MTDGKEVELQDAISVIGSGYSDNQIFSVRYKLSDGGGEVIDIHGGPNWDVLDGSKRKESLGRGIENFKEPRRLSFNPEVKFDSVSTDDFKVVS